MLESIITDYLERHRRLVVPTLGAFLKKEDGQVVFAPFLNKDDGVLAGLVGQNYGASAAEAQGIIDQYADNIRWAIADTGAYLFAPLGALKQDANGNLFLDADEGREPQVVAEEVAIVHETVVEEVVVPEPEPEPEPVVIPSVEEPRTLADTLEQPRTLNDLIRERQEEQQEPPRTIHQQAVEAAGEPKPKPVEKPAHRPAPKPAPKPAAPPASPRRPAPAKPEKRGDVLLIVAVVVAIVAVAALIYGLAAAGMPAFDL